jgi:hypothetical protein
LAKDYVRRGKKIVAFISRSYAFFSDYPQPIPRKGAQWDQWSLDEPQTIKNQLLKKIRRFAWREKPGPVTAQVTI